MVLEATPYIVAVGSSTKCADAFLHRVIDCMVQQIPFSTLCSEFDFSPECPTETSITALSVAASSAFQATINTAASQTTELPDDFKGVLHARLADLRTAQQQAAISQSGKVLADFDWSLRLTVASQTAASVRDPKLLLSLRTGAGGASDMGDQTHLLELSAEALDDAVSALEQAAQVMQQSQS